MKKTCFLLLCYLLIPLFLSSQTPQYCTAPNTPGADNCADACIHCSLNGYSGSTAGFTAGTAPGFCGTVENEQWLGFIAGQPLVTFQVTALNCQQGDGLEMALYPANCAANPIACVPAGGGIGTPLQMAAAITPGQVYFLMIDGYKGDKCNFYISTNSGATGQLPLGITGPLQGPNIVAKYSANTYSITPVTGPTAYTWTAPTGAKINGQNPPVTLPATTGHTVTVTFGDQSGQVCVTPSTVCQSGTESCLNVAVGGAVVPPCPANDTPAADNCADACVYCNFTGYSGSTVGYTADIPVGFCGTIEANQWIGFVAGQSAATITVTPSNCANGNGVQMALYARCDVPPVACNMGQSGGGNIPLDMTAALVPGQTYFLMIDGYAGDECDFTVSITPPAAGQTPAVGAAGPINGLKNVCPGATAVYTIAPVTGAGGYTWSAPPGSLINGQPTPYTGVGAGGNTVTVTFGTVGGQLIAQPKNACTSGSPVALNVVVQPIPPTILPDTVVCAENAPYTLPWGEACIVSGKYCVTLTSYLGCDSLVCQNVTIKAPIVTHLAPKSICIGDAVTVCGESFTQAGTYSVTCQSYLGCDSVVNFSIIVLDPVAMVIPPANLACTAPPVTLNSAPSAGTKAWRNLNGQVIGTGSSLSISNPGTYILQVTASAGGSSCIAADTITIVFNQDLPQASAAGGTLDCNNPTRQLDGASTTPGALFAWSGPNGFSSTAEDPIANAAGTYILTVTNPQNGCTAQASAEVLADTAPPVLEVNNPSTLSCATTSVVISATSPASGLAFAWNGPNGFSASDPILAVKEPGCYTVVASNPANGCTTEKTVCVSQDITPPVIPAQDPAPLTCLTPTRTFSAGTTLPPAYTYAWEGPGNFTSLEPEITVNQAGAYTVTVTNSANGCTATGEINVVADIAVPTAAATGGTLTCAHPTLALNCTTDIAPAIVAYAWSGPANFNSNLLNPVVNQAGTYGVTVTNTQNGCTNSATAEVFVSDSIPVVNILATPALPVLTCAVPEIVLQGATSTPYPEFNWTGPNGFSATAPDITVNTPGVFTLSVQDTLNGCTGFTVLTIGQDIVAPGAAAAGGVLTCKDSVLQLIGSSPTAGVTFAWSGPGIPFPSPAPTISQPGLYTLTVTDPDNGCTSTAVVMVTQDAQFPLVTLGPIAPLSCTTDSVLLDLSVLPASQITWTGPGGFTASGTAVWVTVPGNYTALATNPNNGCTQTVTAVVPADTIAPLVNVIQVQDDVNDQGVGAIDITVNSAGNYQVQWKRDGQPFPSGSEDLSGLHAGVYEVLITASNGCTASAQVVVDNTVGTIAPGQNAFWRIYPNPTTGLLWVQYQGEDAPEAYITVRDMAGRLVLETPGYAPVPAEPIDLRHLASGMYTVTVSTQAGTARLPLVLQSADR